MREKLTVESITRFIPSVGLTHEIYNPPWGIARDGYLPWGYTRDFTPTVGLTHEILTQNYKLEIDTQKNGFKRLYELLFIFACLFMCYGSFEMI
jgi:hypothetical protein